MIKLMLEDYCDGCKEIKPKVDFNENDVFSNENTDSDMTTIIFCEHHKRCNNMYRVLSKRVKGPDFTMVDI